MNEIDDRKEQRGKETNPFPKRINLCGSATKNLFTIILLLILGPWILIGLGFIIFSIIPILSDASRSRNYLETEGILIDYKDCNYDANGEEVCAGIYKYTVDGVAYKASPNLLSNLSSFKQKATVKYDPNNPSQYVMDAKWESLLIAGVIILLLPIGLFIGAKKFIKV